MVLLQQFLSLDLKQESQSFYSICFPMRCHMPVMQHKQKNVFTIQDREIKMHVDNIECYQHS